MVLAKENLTLTGEHSPTATLLLSVMVAFAEFEALILERQRGASPQPSSAASTPAGGPRIPYLPCSTGRAQGLQFDEICSWCACPSRS